MGSYFEFRMPEAVFYGPDSLLTIGEQTRKYGRKCLIISDEVMGKLGNVRKCSELLEQAGVHCTTYLGVNSEPTDTYVEEALAIFQKESCDVIVALGGGSCIDTGKAVAVVASNEGEIADYLQASDINQQPIPLIAIPTTAGTGSEVTSVTVITNTSNDVKMMIKNPSFIPSVAIVDPVLTYTSPPHIIASTGIDALCHAIEAFISRVAQPMCDNYALSAIELIAKHILPSYEGDKLAMDKMAFASMQAGLAFTNASVCLVHGMSRPLGAIFHIPHGVSNAMLLPAVLEFSKESCRERLAVIGRLFREDVEEVSDKEAADKAIEEIKKLCSALAIPNIKEWGVDKDKFQQFVTKMATDAIASGSPANNPKIPSLEEIIALYHTCYDYKF